MISLTCGFIYDIFGRKYTIFIYMIIGSLTAFWAPFTAPHTYSWYLIDRIIFGMTMSAILLNPLIIDYIKSESRSRACAY